MCAFVRDLFYLAEIIYKTTDFSRRFFGLDRFIVLINGVINVFYGCTINIFHKILAIGVLVVTE